MAGPDFRDRTPRHSSAGTVRRIVGRLATVALIAGAAFLAVGLIYADPRFTGLFDAGRGAGPGTAVEGQPGRPASAATVRTDTPPAGFEEHDQPLGHPQKPAVASSSFKFLATNEDGTPVGYSPCRPLHFVVNAALAPDGADQLVEDAIRTVSRATGIEFVDDGPTTEAPAQSRIPYQPTAYGERWAPLLIVWTTPDQAPQLKGPVIGTGGSTHFSFGDGPKSFVTGSLELDAPQIGADLGRQDGAAYATAVILHELGHVMGLEHVDDPAQLMYPEIGTPDGLAAGDLNGLFELGNAPCRKDL
ncbi:matrixin family metalloprotease [Arthrobacter sp. AL08]|uniref:matrixin family metalloprotease n=1 Tax=Micrococcaceae TaxID=1268 RepID=UPI001CFF7FE6|nr:MULTISPECIES: matrixin family metalloprotease [Micrococcaceae]MCB5283868.1 hypothetical protein [Arthrobacter sp. ES1]MDI3242145.1 matrixin family metalloprotease [Arthrobacter sp. AL05]MDI3278250.1 matrixin family metalloprotease [Arthrobacter sp. AL08]MDJ0353262.1 matrixin family metalloprotease [Pseudarthrobacter sp. PH31-O2]WGZ80027.1 matrixin family metalloprotease [Arthrobacter sp. EM1]